MCVAIPSRIVEIRDAMAMVDVVGAKRKVSILLLPDAKPGDYVIVHAGFAIKGIDEEEAIETLHILREIADSSPEAGFERHGDPSGKDQDHDA